MYNIIKISLLVISLSLSLNVNNHHNNDTDLINVNPISDIFNTHTELQQSFLDGDVSKVSEYASGEEELSKPRKLYISYSVEDKENLDTYYVDLGLDSLFSEYQRVITNQESVSFTNLLINENYYYRVIAKYSDKEIISKTYHFKTMDNGLRNIDVDGITNARDIGGKLTSKGRIRQGLIYRNGRLNVSWKGYSTKYQISEKGIKTFKEDLGIKTEIDLRKSYQGEHSYISHSVLGSDVNYFDCSMEYDTSNFFKDNKETIKAAFNVFLNEEYYPITYHCDIGTDRTGMISYLLLGLLGVSTNDIEKDYAFSNFADIGSSRSISTFRNKIKYISSLSGKTLQDKIKNYLMSIGIMEYKINNFIDLMIEK